MTSKCEQTGERENQSGVSAPRQKRRPELHRQFLAILATGEKPPPSLREVARRLSCGLSVLHERHPDLCHQLSQQQEAHRQEQTALLEMRVREILAANQTPPPPVKKVARQLGVGFTFLKLRLPALYAEFVRRHQAYRESEKQRRKVFLDQLVTENPIPPPSLEEIAEKLGCHGATLQSQFPEVSRVLMARYQAHQKQARTSAQAALEAALRSELSPPLLPFQVAQELGHTDSTYLITYFPDLCHRLVERYEAYKRQTAREKLETFLAEAPTNPPLPLETVSRQLGYNCPTLKSLCPELCRIIANQHQNYWSEKKLAIKRALKMVLSGERTPPPPLRAIAREFGYTPDALRRAYPDLAARVVEKYKTHLRERGQQSRQRLNEEVKHLTRKLYREGIDPTLHRIALYLPSPKMIISPCVRQAWREARGELGLST